MADTSIRVSEETKARLDLHKRKGESYDDVIRRLTERDKWAGFGALSETETGTATAMQRVREEMREGMADDVEESE